ncbi:MAG: hypothetical protein HGB02_00050 [Chlorobiaceae bacterium]|nr:hypothetical protein [Chlorobiaceae bacterium]
MYIISKRLVTAILAGNLISISALPASTVAAAPFDSLTSVLTSGEKTDTVLNSSGTTDQAIRSSPYFTDREGNILMNVNIWGNVARSGTLSVPEGTDIGTALSMAGGPSNSAKLSEVRVNRARTDQNGQSTYLVNLSDYVRNGDRSGLLELNPGDTIIVPESRKLGVLGILGIIATGATIYSVTR